MANNLKKKMNWRIVSAICYIQIQWKGTKHFEIGLKRYRVIEQNSLLKKKYLQIKNTLTCFYFLYVKLATIQIWEQSNKFPLTCSSLKCLLLEEKLFPGNRAKKHLFASQTKSVHKHSQLWKVNFRSAPGKIYARNLQWTLVGGSQWG